MSTVEQPSYEELAALVVALTERLVAAEAADAVTAFERTRVERIDQTARPTSGELK